MYARQRQYQSVSLASRIEAASPHELVSILYEELLRSFDVCRTAIAQGKKEVLQAAHERASSVLVSLQISLDHQRGGSLAQSLSGVYASMARELIRATQERDSDRFAKLRQGVADLLNAWIAIGKSS